MNKRKDTTTTNKIMVDINELAQMCSIGTASARKLGEDAGAVVCLGRRKVYNVKKIEEYLEKMS